MSYISLPYTPKIFYGIITDTFPIFSSRKKSYVIIFGLVQCFAALGIAFKPDSSAGLVCFLATMIYLSQAFNDVVVDGLMVSQQRLDPETGSENLQAYSWICYGIGGALFGILGGFFLESLSASFVFYMVAGLGLLITINGLFIPMVLEEGAKEIINMGFWQRTKTNAKEIWYGLKIRPLYRCIIFFFIFSGVIPSYSDYFYYYLTDVLEFSDFQYSILNVVSTFTLIIAVYFYNLWFKDIESAWMLIACCVINIIGSINSMLLVLGFTFGMSPDAFVFLSNTVTDTLNNCI